MENNKKEKKQTYQIRIGEKLRKILDKIKSKVNDYAYNSLEISDKEAGEILAKKVEEKKLV